MKKRCKDSKFLKNFDLKGFKLTFRSIYRAADIEIKKDSIVTGALFEISKNDEQKLDLFEDLLFFSKENKILFQLIEQSLKNGDYSGIDIDINFLENINKFATVKHIVKKNDDNHSKLLEIFEDIKKDLKTYSLELRIQQLESKFAEDFNQNTFDEIRRLKKEQNIN